MDQGGAFGAFTDTLDLLIDITGVTGAVATGKLHDVSTTIYLLDMRRRGAALAVPR